MTIKNIEIEEQPIYEEIKCLLGELQEHLIYLKVLLENEPKSVEQ